MLVPLLQFIALLDEDGEIVNTPRFGVMPKRRDRKYFAKEQEIPSKRFGQSMNVIHDLKDNRIDCIDYNPSFIIYGGEPITTFPKCNDLYMYNIAKRKWIRIYPYHHLDTSKVAKTPMFHPNGNLNINYFREEGESSSSFPRFQSNHNFIQYDCSNQQLMQHSAKETFIVVPYGTVNHGSVLIEDPITKQSKLYIYGGFDGYMRTNNTFIFNFSTKKWTQLRQENMKAPYGRAAHTCVLYHSRNANKMIVFSGWNHFPFHAFSDMHEFDIQTQEWNEIFYANDLVPEKRLATAACMKNDQVMIIFGGKECFGERRFNDIHEFDFVHRIWTVITPVDQVKPAPRGGSRIAMCSKNRMLMFGGRNQEGSVKDGFWLFDFQSLKWTHLGAIPQVTPRTMHSMHCLKRHKKPGMSVFVFAGNNVDRDETDIFLNDLVELAIETEEETFFFERLLNLYK